jgi:hypothetical protein
MHERTLIFDGVTKLIAQAQQVIPGMLKDADATSDLASETSDNTASFDVSGWGDEMFSLAEMREELERLRVETAPSNVRSGNSSIGDGTESVLCSLPAMVPTLPRGLFVTAEMQSVLDAVLSETSTSQIGFCGMGGIGKTTVSSWVAHDDAVRTRFGMIAWISLGQTPTLDACFNLLYLQLTGAPMADGLPSDQKHEHLKQAFLNRSVLFVLDDCWDAEVANHFKWIDPNTNSKILISSRVHNVLDGGDIIDVTVPSQIDAIKMLLSTAGMDIEALKSRAEVAQVAELCKRLPLTIGIAGKLIKEITTGSSMTDASDWADVVELLHTELNDPDGDLSIEESVIRASIKSIPTKVRKQVTRLFYGFALVPEDMHVPLPVLGMIFDVCGNVNDGKSSKKSSTNKPISRMHIRNYLKVLINRSLVLGTVDRPQLHDVMLEFVKKELAGEVYKAAQRQLVDAFRKMDRSQASATGKYMQLCIKHHITDSYDEMWGKSPQAMSWLEDHVKGVQDGVAISTAFVLPDVEALAKEAEALENWWPAALRWNSLGLSKIATAGWAGGGYEYFEHAVKASANIVMPNVGDGDTSESFTQFDLDYFNLKAMSTLVLSWSGDALAAYGEKITLLAATDAGKSNPVLLMRVCFVVDWFAGLLSGNNDQYTAACWKVTSMLIDLSDESTDAYSRLTQDERDSVNPFGVALACFGGDAMLRAEGFTLDSFGPNGDKLVEWFNAYDYDKHHTYSGSLFSVDTMIVYNIHDWLLTMLYGRVSDAIPILDERLRMAERVLADTSSPSRSNDLAIFGSQLMLCYHVHGRSDGVQKTCEVFGFTLDSVGELLSEWTKDNMLLVALLLDQIFVLDDAMGSHTCWA